MRARTLIFTVPLVVSAAAAAWCWGWTCHRTLNDAAVDLLPPELRAFYDARRSEIVERSIEPDRWTEQKSYPGYTHYIDLDELDSAPFGRIPKTWPAAVAKYGEQRLRGTGTLPWEIERRTRELSRTFREGRWDDAAAQSAWLAHFVADATMPLHTTADYHGRRAGNLVFEERGPNRSVHMRLEWGLIEHYPQAYGDVRGDAANVRHLDDVLGEAWATVRHSYDLLTPVLAADRQATALDPTCGRVYYDAFEQSMRPLVTRRMQRAEELIASVWLTAWEDAGSPRPPVSASAASGTADRPLLLRNRPLILSSTFAFMILLGWVVLRYLRLRRMNRPR